MVLKRRYIKIKFKRLISNETIIIGNLPYNISTQILSNLYDLNWPPKFKRLIFMFQKEVGEKNIGKNWEVLIILDYLL